MLNIRALKIDANATFGSKTLLVDVVSVYEYKDNQRRDKIVRTAMSPCFRRNPSRRSVSVLMVLS